MISTKIMGIMGLTAMLTAGACVSTSLIAANIQKESACKSTSGGAKAYHWAWATAVAALPGSSAPSLIHLEFGKISARSGVHRTEGLNYLEQVLREPLEGGSGGYGTAHWRKGQILRDLGRKAEAGAAARAALALDPKDGRAADLLKELNLGSTS